jgi:hypothetical protein
MTQVSELRKTASLLRLRGIENYSQRNFNVPAPQAKRGAGFNFSWFFPRQNPRLVSWKKYGDLGLKTILAANRRTLIKQVLIY